MVFKSAGSNGFGTSSYSFRLKTCGAGGSAALAATTKPLTNETRRTGRRSSTTSGATVGTALASYAMRWISRVTPCVRLVSTSRTMSGYSRLTKFTG